MKTALSLFLFHAASIGIAFADEPVGATARQGVTPFIPLVLIFGIFYFLIMRPQQKKQKQHETFLKELKRGDMVITNGGIIGTVRTVSDRFVTVEVDDGVCLKLVKNQILENANTLKEESKAKAPLLAQTQEEKK